MERLLGVDTGGTFTDFFLVEPDGSVRVHKELSTPARPEEAILAGVAALGLRGASFKLVHGSTVATNAVLEGKGARTAFVTNRGLRDLLTIGRQARPELYALQPQPVAPPVPRELCLETGGRLGADASAVEDLSAADLEVLVAAIRALAPEAVAVTLLFSFLDDRFERAIAAALPADLFVSISSEVLAEYREYERGIATWLNAYVGPRVQGYLARLVQQLDGVSLRVMQSSGLSCDPGFAGRRAVNLLLSGPAGGLAGARLVAAAAGRPKILTLDMGGTSTDVALLAGEPQLTSEGRIGRYPVGVPMVDMHTIGAGGGSIARIDAGGVLHVGPESAGAQPGPACYGQGGTLATVTDANLVLGRLPRELLLGERLALDTAAAERAVGDLAAALGLDLATTAQGIVDVANEHMQQALRVISVERGIDPRDHTLVSFGGAGGLHVCALAEALQMREALVPARAGVLSALGMLAAAPGRQRSRSIRRPFTALAESEVAAWLDELAAAGHAELVAEGLAAQDITAQASVDVCYQGQSFTLNLPWQSKAEVETAFHAAHARRYGHRLDLGLVLVNVRVALRATPAFVALPEEAAQRPAEPVGTGRVHGIADAVPVWRRERLPRGVGLPGPLVVVDALNSTWVAPGWTLTADRHANCLLTRTAR
ncbi:MAG: hydantoinase/oxoprolinase family protein [Gammaproteobacteria bacterium]|nr:hydantoinase/oxoprolinase family protein [Gammaproteobacteria bacterium]